jgi:hypothetical protein
MGQTIGNNRLVFFASGGITSIVNAKTGWFECSEEGALEMDTVDGMSTPVWYANQYSFSGLDPDTWYTTPLPARSNWNRIGSSGIDWTTVYSNI